MAGGGKGRGGEERKRKIGREENVSKLGKRAGLIPANSTLHFFNKMPLLSSY